MRGGAAPDPIPALIKRWNLDAPFHIQYATWLGEVLKGNLGYCHLYDLSVVDTILHFLPATVELVVFASPIIIVGGYKLGVLSAKRSSSKAPRQDPVDYSIKVMTTIGYSAPSFVVGYVLLLFVTVYFGWLPIGRLDQSLALPAVRYTGFLTIDGILNGRLDVTSDALMRLVLPVITLAVQNLAILVRITRSGMIGELSKQYIVTAKAKGLPDQQVVRHAEKNSLVSIMTVSGILFANMLTGVVVTEYVFNFKGLGYLTVNAASRLDFPLLVGLALFFCVVFMLVNLIVDIAYTHLDPRIKT
jgi:peptide/nickel transport system permease protein